MDPSSTEGSPKALNATPLEDDATRRRLRAASGTKEASWASGAAAGPPSGLA